MSRVLYGGWFGVDDEVVLVLFLFLFFVLLSVFLALLTVLMRCSSAPAWPVQMVPKVSVRWQDVMVIYPAKRMPDQEDCVVCMSQISDTDMVRQLACKHTFHSDCIDSWWRRDRLMRCPYCRHQHFDPGFLFV
mmetsp:Transcript_32244/g.63968  ORF Transcript_32244/g.63968 Transcript_32244/m.63968 type:complete len:133 (+) Transcript_32244:71-469(+)